MEPAQAGLAALQAPGQRTRLNHLGVEVESTEVTATTRRKHAELATFEEIDTSCCC
ncbi:hypothetical protein [Streptomyces sp. NRRL S-1813]|uniref:hypothetical protein n=1 Tax=Streptomyces sp. NRRL S-1813 TaxID=1463888 RepID=UPI000A8A3589